VPVFATIDVGTNSMKLFVGEVAEDATTETPILTLAEGLEITRLGEGLARDGRLSEAAIARNADQLCAFVNRARELGAHRIAVAGTMALRTAVNARDFVERARARCDIEVEVIEGEEEARLSFLAVSSGMGELAGRTCVFDTGGGSTEFMLGRERELLESFSLDIGVRAPTEEYLRHDPPLVTELAALRKSLASDLEEAGRRSVSPLDQVERLVGMGGTVTTLAAVQLGMTRYDPEAIRGTLLGREEIERQIALYARLPLPARQEIDGLAPKRADVILAGACIVAAVLERFDKDELLVSERGLRHGLFYDRFVPAH
jgi:exopolyphosphatase/guanosine-5'-triphosphate,3'-diphosphate pyrophosphatase